ncbi:hypothetical protein CHS0354_002883 [Potamilus streckersoni]|uniref:DZIP3-like HEPN domain-containing protein n=1 Tax=Potamilus streckersoni TaxID=2493646 RepID=A0AAE0SMJ1_9BIVA|nr:hypothetical protein CHS0354_002883 [Potamilus streckersoni]
MYWKRKLVYCPLLIVVKYYIKKCVLEGTFGVNVAASLLVLDENYFLAPCMLRETAPEEVISPKPLSDMESSSVLCYVFTEQFLPAPIFHRLLSACVAHWPVVKKNSEILIFCGCCVFKLDLHHRLTLFFRGHVISVRVTRMGTTERTPSSTLCIEVKEFMTLILSNIIGNLEQSLQFELFIRCPKSDGYRVNSLIPVSDLQNHVDVLCDSHGDSHLIRSSEVLSFWFEAENEGCTQMQANNRNASLPEEDEDESSVVPDYPITQEHINHFRLCNALTTVCADALRVILLTQFPAQHKNICQALLASQTILTKGGTKVGKKQKALLNQDQSQRVFPDPKGRYIGAVEQYDITLLYTLIRNVSSVSPPTPGWGSPPTDNPMDTTLGASVERIRLYRNSISGHSADGKISQQQFEDYWNLIGNVLCDIETIIGDHGYQEELEKRRTQVIIPHEAREKRKKIIEYIKGRQGCNGPNPNTLQTLLPIERPGSNGLNPNILYSYSALGLEAELHS